jgi:hypothetical protein
MKPSDVTDELLFDIEFNRDLCLNDPALWLRWEATLKLAEKIRNPRGWSTMKYDAPAWYSRRGDGLPHRVLQKLGLPPFPAAKTIEQVLDEARAVLANLKPGPLSGKLEREKEERFLRRWNISGKN